MPDLLIASRNPDKIGEIRALLKDLPYALHSLAEFPELPETVEDQDTIGGNAMKKALEASQATGMLCLADDTGFFIAALDGAPGVLAARFAGSGCSYKDNREKALRMLEGMDERRAEFRTCVALAAPDGIIACREGIMPGRISRSERGANGFGYDSIFEPEGDTRTYAEMTDAEKNAISHRAKALALVLPVLTELIKVIQ